MQDELKSLAPIGLYAAAAHGGSVLAMGAGAVSFAQIVKAGVCVCVCVCNTINTLADILNPKSN
jgi:solute carrier family 35 protein E1